MPLAIKRLKGKICIYQYESITLDNQNKGSDRGKLCIPLGLYPHWDLIHGPMKPKASVLPMSYIFIIAFSYFSSSTAAKKILLIHYAYN